MGDAFNYKQIEEILTSLIRQNSLSVHIGGSKTTDILIAGGLINDRPQLYVAADDNKPLCWYVADANFYLIDNSGHEDHDHRLGVQGYKYFLNFFDSTKKFMECANTGTVMPVNRFEDSYFPALNINESSLDGRKISIGELGRQSLLFDFDVNFVYKLPIDPANGNYVIVGG